MFGNYSGKAKFSGQKEGAKVADFFKMEEREAILKANRNKESYGGTHHASVIPVENDIPMLPSNSLKGEPLPQEP